MTETWHLWLFMGAGRGIAMSGVQMGTMVAVTNWFVVKRGRAAAIPSFGVRAGQAIVPLAILPIIVGYGWREAYWALSVSALLLIAVPAWVFLRRRPEDHGLHPDGIAPEPASDDAPRASRVVDEVRWTLREATHTRAFWLLITVTATGMFGQTAANLHVVANFQDKGMTVALSITIPAIFAGVSAVSTFAWGYAIERLQARPALAAVAVLNTLGMVILVYGASSYPVAVVYAAVAGLAGGGFLVAQRVIWADYYGRFSVGTIRGFASLFIGLVGPIGPLLAGILYDRSGTYSLAFTIAGVLFAIGFFAMLFAPRPVKRT
jgi:MFS family permease